MTSKPGRQGFTPSEADLRQLTETLWYEIQMAFDLGESLALSTGPLGSSIPQVVKNAMLESFTIHVRQLIDFFWTRRSKHAKTERDAFATDFFDPGEWDRIRPARPAVLGPDLADKVGWGVAHLTYGRAIATPEQKQWPTVVICGALVPAIRTFIENVDPTKLDPMWFQFFAPLLDRFEAAYPGATSAALSQGDSPE